jgi:hypothetical protein
MLLKKLDTVLPNRVILELADAILMCPNLNDESGQPQYYGNSAGITNMEQTMPYVPELTELVKTIYDRPIKFSNTYSRIYKNESYLGIHIDRPGLDITMSICVGKTAKMKWPLCVSLHPWVGHWNPEQNKDKWLDLYASINLNVGEAGLMEGIIYPHWRDTLICNPDEYALYVFYHWTKE